MHMTLMDRSSFMCGCVDN